MLAEWVARPSALQAPPQQAVRKGGLSSERVELPKGLPAERVATLQARLPAQRVAGLQAGLQLLPAQRVAGLRAGLQLLPAQL
eukprot:14717533-Alexandrium_andersonii.AAC.1